MANHYIRQGAIGSNNGSDWTNAWTSFAAVTWTRGDSYYVADGTYAGFLFSAANSGTTVITVLKATISSHGTSTGWLDIYGDGQAIINSQCQIYPSSGTGRVGYLVMDGQGRDANWRTGAHTQYGFRINSYRLDNASGGGAANVTWRYCDIHGDGRDTGNGDDVIYSLVSNANLTWQYCSLRDSDRTIWITAGGLATWTTDQCYIGRNTSSAAVHAEMHSCWGSATNYTFSNNYVEDIEGTAIFAGINDGTMSQWNVFGNVFKYTDAMLANQYVASEFTDFGKSGTRPGIGSGAGQHNGGIVGVFFIANDASNNNFGDHILFYNNSIHGIKLASTLTGIIIQAGAGANEVRNNIWYDCTQTSHSFTGTISHNWYYLTTSSGDGSATKQTGTADPFVGEDSNNYKLTGATQAGFTLSAPYNIDPDGVTRGGDGTWDRGAFEFGTGVDTTPPAAPTNVRIL